MYKKSRRETVITSYIPGRVRIRHCALQNKKTMESLTSMVHGHEGVTSVIANLRTGSILVEYNTSIISEEMLEGALSALKSALPEKKNFSKKIAFSIPVIPRGVEQQLLKASYGALLLGLWGSKRLHAIAGGLFVIGSLSHMVRKGALFSVKEKTKC